jgi:putative salt-induced outer membrane protein YdiY
MNRLNLTILMCLVLFSCGTAVGDQLTLKNGDRVSGTIIKSDGKTIVFKGELVGELNIALENISEITADKPLYVGLADGRTVVGTVRSTGGQTEIRTSGNVVTVAQGNIQFVRSEDEQKIYEKTLNPGWFEQWTGGADLGIALTKGNSDTTNVALGMAISRTTLKDKTGLYAAAVYNRDGTSGVSRTVANTIRFGGRYDRDFNKRWFGYGFSDLERNGLQDLNLRFVVGGGIGYHAIRNERTSLDILGGLAMNREYFDGLDNDRTSAEAQVGQTLSHQFSSRVSLKEQLFFFPNLSRGGEYRINFDTSLITDITRRIGWQITLSDRYLSDPPPGFKQNDLLLTTGIRLKLGELK